MKKFVAPVLVLILTINLSFLLLYKPVKISGVNLKDFNTEELGAFNGTDPTKPIYLAMNGDVYDVTAGKKFYEVGGNYHDLAGKDSSKELNFAGGGIIKMKYKVIGKLVKP